jgi:Tol biopolymer transport system component
VRWSNNGKYLAINTNSVDSGKRVDLISIFNISTCNSTNPFALDNFPATRFTMTGYSSNGIIPSFDSDGSTLFVLNSKVRYELGNLYSYNTETKHSEKLDPLGTTCCYTAAHFSPDGSFLLFFYQNVNNAITKLFYVSYGSIGTGTTYTSMSLPDSFFSALTDHLDVTLRPVTP